MESELWRFRNRSLSRSSPEPGRPTAQRSANVCERLTRLINRTERSLCNNSAILDHLVHAFADQLTLDRRELMN
jgi:hypothetical protein